MEDQFRAICGSPIWNTEVVYASFPDFTFCFQYTILKWIPCAALWLCAPFWTYMLTRTVQYKLKFSLVSLLKIISTMFLISIELFYLTKAINNSKFIVHYMTPMILIVTYILVLLFDHFERVRGLRSSSLLFAFWLLQFLCSSITFRSKILYHIHYNHHTDFTEVYLFYVYYAICIFELVVSTFSEKFADKSYHKSQKKMKMTPENLTPLLSKITYLWIDPLIRKGFRRSLMRTDVWEVEASETSELIAQKFEREWDSYIQRYNRLVEQENNANHNNNANNNNNKKVTAMYKTTTKNNEEELILKKGVSEMDVKNTKHVKEPSLIWCLCKVFGGKFLAGTFLKFVSDLLCFAPPILLDLIIKFVNDKDQTMLVGIFLTILLFLSSIAQSMLLQHYYFRSYLVGARIRTALVNLIYKKTFRLSTQSRNASTGTVTNLVAVNAQLFLTITAFLNMLWSSPFQIVICIYMLWHYLGIAAIAGLATTIIFIPLNVIAANLNKTLSVKKLESQDMRLKLLTEMLNGIKVIKFYGWELSFQRIIDKVRNEEMGHYTRFALVGIIQSFTWSSAPFFVAAVSYATFTLTSDRILDPPTAFVSFTLFYLIRFPLALLPQTITMLIQGYVALKRIKTFLLLEETNENDIKHENTGEIAIMMKNVYVGWEKNVPFLCNLNFEIKKKKLYAVVGGIGSGKSSLLSALLGEMYKLNEGKINVNGSIAYVSQQAWIQNSTVRDNILFGRDYNELYYNRVISACSLLADFDIMPLRDKTEIGERGINLSGGQKQRISLARALYAKADIYLLDDPLSAVDAHVGKSIFDNVVGPNGLLKNKTRLFVTNSLCFLPQVDQIIMLDGGTIAEIGTYDELRNKESGTFAEFIRNFLANNELNNRIMESAEAQVQEKRDKPIQEEDIVSELGFKGKPLLHKQDSMGSHYGSDFFHNVRLNHNTGTPSRTDGAIIDKENIQSGTIKLSVVLDYMKKSGIANGVIFIILFLMSNVALSASSFWLSTWSNDSENPDEAKKLKIYRLTVYLILGCIQCILLNISNIFLVLMYLRAARLYHKKLLFSILRSTLHFFESTPIGRIINRFSRDIESLETAIPDSFKICLFCLSNIIHTFIILAYTTPFSLLLILPSTIIYIFIQRYYVSSARQLTRLDSTTKSPIFSHLSETFSGVSTIRAYRSQATFSKRMQKHVDENTVYLYTGNCAERWLIVRLDFIANLITGLASMFAVFSRNSLSPGLVGLSISLSITVSQALNFFVKMGAEFEANITAVERIKEYFNIPHEAKWTLDNSPAEGTTGTGTSGVGGKSSVISSSHVWPTEGRLEFREYSAKYSKNNDYVLNEINAVILPGEKIGIVGRTGAGKSSLTLALFRLIEVSEGDIIIDDVNINKIGLHDLRHNITIIPQDPIIFSGTIRMNLDPFEKHTDDEIWTALELAHLKDFLVNTEEKLDFECKEDGKNLSLGQRQLICLARALLRKNKILILDEATAAVDHNTDELIQQTIRSEFKNNTVLTIAHRLNTIMDSSRIMVLDRGRIVEFDTPENLLANKNGYFYSMSKDANLTE